MKSLSHLPVLASILLIGLSACQASGNGSTSSSSADSTNTDTSGGTSGGSSGDTSGGTSGDFTAVDAGLDQVVAAGGTVNLSASAASGTTVTWEQVSGPTVDLSNAAVANPSFTAPAVAETTSLSFRIEASDGTSDTVAVEVWVPFDQADATVLGDFSGHADWQCDVNPGIVSDYHEDAMGSVTAVTANSIPDHAVGTFPNDGNPNSISEQDLSYDIPFVPEKTDTATAIKEFGITLDGVPFDPNTAECYNNEAACSWRYEAVTPAVASNAGGTSWVGASSQWIGTDCNNAHVQPTGKYHYHGLPESLVNKLGDDGSQMMKIGLAADGFPIYGRWGHADAADSASAIVRMKGSYALKAGTRPGGPGGAYSGIFVQDWEYVEGSGDLDECNGRFGVTPEYPDGIYHYYITDTYPYVPRCVFGTVVDNQFKGAGL